MLNLSKFVLLQFFLFHSMAPNPQTDEQHPIENIFYWHEVWSLSPTVSRRSILIKPSSLLPISLKFLYVFHFRRKCPKLLELCTRLKNKLSLSTNQTYVVVSHFSQVYFCVENLQKELSFSKMTPYWSYSKILISSCGAQISRIFSWATSRAWIWQWSFRQILFGRTQGFDYGSTVLNFYLPNTLVSLAFWPRM